MATRERLWTLLELDSEEMNKLLKVARKLKESKPKGPTDAGTPDCAPVTGPRVVQAGNALGGRGGCPRQE